MNSPRRPQECQLCQVDNPGAGPAPGQGRLLHEAARSVKISIRVARWERPAAGRRRAAGPSPSRPVAGARAPPCRPAPGAINQADAHPSRRISGRAHSFACAPANGPITKRARLGRGRRWRACAPTGGAHWPRPGAKAVGRFDLICLAGAPGAVLAPASSPAIDITAAPAAWLAAGRQATGP